MASEYKARHCLSGLDVTNLIRRFYRRLYDSGWETADEFVKWCSENGYKSGLRLCRKDTSKPHGPENSYFKSPETTTRAIKEDIRRRKLERKELVSPFCEGCQKKCRASSGCEEYKQWFTKNWNENISIARHKPVTVAQEGPMVWRYEHPDLVREGIIFANSQSIP